MSPSPVAEPRSLRTETSEPTSSRPAWLRAYVELVRWSAVRYRYVIPTVTFVQVAFAAAVVLGLPLLIGEVDTEAVTRLSTGAWTLGLVGVGLVIAPQIVGQDKAEGVVAHQRTMPVPRAAIVLADSTVWVLASLPGVLAGVATAALRFDLPLDVGPGTLPVLVLAAVTCVGPGYALAHVLPPAATAAITQLIILLCMLFSPLTVDPDRLPGWLLDVHAVLPFAPMARVIRGSLTSSSAGLALADVVVLTLWAGAGLVVATTVLARRG